MCFNNNIILRLHCDTKLNQIIDMETEIPFPEDFRCPISQDIMNEPVVVTHHGVDYHFDEACIKTWKTTPNGDKNPLTMMSGFLEATVKKDLDMKERIQAFRISHGLCTDAKTEEVKLEPFSDYQQIQDDEEVARRLHMEMNGPPPGIIPISILMIEDDNGHHEIEIPHELMSAFMRPNMEEERNIFVNSIRNIINNIDNSIEVE